MFSTNRVKTACFILLVILVLLLVYASATNRKSGGAEGKYHGGADYTHKLLPVSHGLGHTGEGISSRERGHRHKVQHFKGTGKNPEEALTRHKHPIRDIDDDDEDITKFMVPVGEE